MVLWCCEVVRQLCHNYTQFTFWSIKSENLLKSSREFGLFFCRVHVAGWRAPKTKVVQSLQGKISGWYELAWNCTHRKEIYMPTRAHHELVMMMMWRVIRASCCHESARACGHVIVFALMLLCIYKTYPALFSYFNDACVIIKHALILTNRHFVK